MASSANNPQREDTGSHQTLSFRPTCDVYDALGPDKARVPDVAWMNYGGISHLCGVVAATVQCNDDNSWVKQILEAKPPSPPLPLSPSSSSETKALPITVVTTVPFLVVDGNGSRRCALMGDQIAAHAVHNGWRGVLVDGSVRDVDALATLPLCVKAIGCTPRKSNRASGIVASLSSSSTGTRDGTVHIGTNRIAVSVGDYVFVDNDGVVFVSSGDINVVLASI